MAVNDFEKNARKLLDEFKLHPSEQVWQNVEERIREKKRKRRILFFMIFSCAFLALGGYGVYQMQGTRGKAQEAKIKTQLTTTENTNPGNSDSLHLTSVNTISSQNKATAKTSITHEVTGEKQQAQKSAIAFKNNDGILKRKDQVPATSPKQNESEKQGSANDASSLTTPDNSSDNKQGIPIDTTDHTITLAPGKKDTVIASLVDSTTTKQKSEQTANTKPSKKITQSKKKIEWGASISAGASTITQDHFSNGNANYSSGNLSSAPGPYTGGGSIYPQSANKPSFAFMAGVTLRKNISKRSSLSAGIQYSYMADKIKIGSLQTIPQSGYYYLFSSYYGGAAKQTYTNHFHFIDVPLMYDWRITNNTKHFLSLNAGISVSFLISTNALVYDTAASGIYYHNKNSFAHAIINFIPGLSYHFSAKNFEWSLGPQVYFDLNRFIKSDPDQRKYLFYGGVNAKLFFEKKK